MKEAERQKFEKLTLEIRNLAHRGWEDRPNAEFLFREIGKRAQQIAELSARASESSPPQPEYSKRGCGHMTLAGCPSCEKCFACCNESKCSGEVLKELEYFGITFVPDVEEHWEVAAEPEPRYFETFKEAMKFFVSLKPFESGAAATAPSAPPTEEVKLLRGKDVAKMTTENLIDWIAALAHAEKEDWGFLKAEILARIPAAPSAPKQIGFSECLMSIPEAVPSAPPTVKRTCVKCGAAISECMGFVKASDFMDAVEGRRSWTVDGYCNVRELCGKCSMRWMWDGELLIRTEAAPSVPTATPDKNASGREAAEQEQNKADTSASRSGSGLVPPSLSNEPLAAPTATDWMRQAWEQGRDAAAQVADHYDCLIAHNIRVLAYAGEHAGAESKKEPTV